MRPLSIALGACCIAALGMKAPPGAAAEDAGTKLSHKAHKQWDFVLPAERWHKVGGVIAQIGRAHV